MRMLLKKNLALIIVGVLFSTSFFYEGAQAGLCSSSLNSSKQIRNIEDLVYKNYEEQRKRVRDLPFDELKQMLLQNIQYAVEQLQKYPNEPQVPEILAELELQRGNVERSRDKDHLFRSSDSFRAFHRRDWIFKERPGDDGLYIFTFSVLWAQLAMHWGEKLFPKNEDNILLFLYGFSTFVVQVGMFVVDIATLPITVAMTVEPSWCCPCFFSKED